MLKMAQINYIKHLREVEGCSISEIARKVGIAWETAKKYADGDIDLTQNPKRKCKRPVMGTYEHVVDAWLEEDLRIPKKQRRSAKAIYKQLLELGFTGANRTVRHYVRQRKKAIKNQQKNQYARLAHDPATAQADFGEFRGVYPPAEEKRTYHFLVLSFPYSNGQLCRVMPAENRECLFFALQDIFTELNGVPRVIWFDNMTTAVKEILKGPKRQLTDAFQQFKWHYRFEASFTNPNRGHEKGHVEGKVGYVRRNFFSPLPIIRDLQKFNNCLKHKMVQDRNRIHSTKGEKIATLWEKDIENLLPLPQNLFEIARAETGTVNKFGEVTLDGKRYHIPSAHPGQELFLKVHWNKIEAFDQYGEEKIGQQPRNYLQKPELIDWGQELSLYRRKPRAIEHALYLKALPQPLRDYLLQVESSARSERVNILINLFKDFGLNEIQEAIEVALEADKTALADLKGILLYHEFTEPEKDSSTPIAEPWTPEEVSNWQPVLTDYEKLYPGVVNRD